MQALDCPNCSTPNGLKLRERGQHTEVFGCSCGHVGVRDRGCHPACGCAR